MVPFHTGARHACLRDREMAVWDSVRIDVELGAELVKGSFISPEDLSTAEGIASGAGRRLSEVLVAQRDALPERLTNRITVQRTHLPRSPFRRHSRSGSA